MLSPVPGILCVTVKDAGPGTASLSGQDCLCSSVIPDWRTAGWPAQAFPAPVPTPPLLQQSSRVLRRASSRGRSKPSPMHLPVAISRNSQSYHRIIRRLPGSSAQSMWAGCKFYHAALNLEWNLLGATLPVSLAAECRPVCTGSVIENAGGSGYPGLGWSSSSPAIYALSNDLPRNRGCLVVYGSDHAITPGREGAHQGRFLVVRSARCRLQR